MEKLVRKIGLVAHDAMKKDLIEWVLWNSELLMGHKFYKQAHEYAREQMRKSDKTIYFSMQSNLLSYDKKNCYDYRF